MSVVAVLNGTNGAPSGDPTLEKRWELAHRIVSSNRFRKSPRLRDLFLYLCRRAIDEAASEIHEQEVGAGVFGRPSNYDTSQDPIVRVQMSQLRRKLQQYFASEGIDERLTVEIPKGGYVPVFRERAESEPFKPERSVDHLEARPWLVPWLTAAVVVLAAACAWLATRNVSRPKSASEASPSLERLWSSFFQPNQQTTIVVADSCLSLLQDAIKRPVGLTEYLRRDYAQWLEQNPSDPKLNEFLKMMMARQYTSLADVGLVGRILALSPAQRQPVSLVFARNYQVRGASTDNLILLGSRRSNPWFELFEKSLNFRFDYDEELRKAIVRNRAPRAGELETYQIPGLGAGIQEGYAVIAFLPNLSRSGHVLLIAGTDMEATEAAGQVTTTEAQLARVLQVLPRKGKDGLPYFEVLLKTKRVGGAPSEAHIVAWRLPQI